jgi:hypothetical protein
MKRRMPTLIKALLVLTISGFASAGHGQTTAASCSQSDVQTAITKAGRGGTVNVPAGNCTWSSTLNITYGITLLGAGSSSTVITGSGGATFITANPDSTAIANGQNIRIDGFTFDGANSSTIFMNLSGASGITGTKPYCCYVIGNNTFKNQGAGTSDGVITAANANADGQLRGVIYSNTFDRTDISMRVFSDNDTREWANAAFNNLVFGTSDNLFFESNTIKCSTSYAGGDSGWIETGQGGRLVARYNSYNMANCGTLSEFNDIHGFQNWTGTVNSGQTGSMISERYGNTYTNVGEYRCEDMRGGIDLTFNNSFSGTGGCSFDIYGQTGGASCPSNISPTPTNYNPLVHDAYFWNNPMNGTNVLASLGYVGTLGCTVKENNGASIGTLGSSSQGGWWNQNASCTASSCAAGIGQGTTAPTGTCTLGTAYWVASTPGLTTDPNVIQNATLYRCTATNTWTKYYEPYAYPHPLRSSAPAPAPPTNLSASSS